MTLIVFPVYICSLVTPAIASYIITLTKPAEGLGKTKEGDNLEWFDVLSLFWYAIGIAFIIGALFIVTTIWLFFEFYRASVSDEDDLERHE